MSDEQNKLTEKMQQAFVDLCEENPPQAFVAITIGEDLMVNFASYGMDDNGTVDLLMHMVEHIKKQESEEDYGREEGTTLH